MGDEVRFLISKNLHEIESTLEVVVDENIQLPRPTALKNFELRTRHAVLTKIFLFAPEKPHSKAPQVWRQPQMTFVHFQSKADCSIWVNDWDGFVPSAAGAG